MAPAQLYDEFMAAQPATALPVHRIDVETYDQIVATGTLETRTRPGKTGYSQVDTHREGDLIPCAVEGAEDLDLAVILREAGV